MAVALVGNERTVQRATALFLDCCGSADAFLAAFESEIDSVLSGDADQLSARLDQTTLDISAILDRGGSRCALLTIARPPDHGSAEGGIPLLDQAIDASPAIVWLKDLDGRYLRVNGKYVEQLQVAAERVCGKTEGELAAGESIEGLRWRDGDKGSREPLELEYTVGAADGRPAFAVLRFALRDGGGKPVSVCGVAAPLARAGVARSECARLIRLERWGRSDEPAVRAELIAEWELAAANQAEEEDVAAPANREPAASEEAGADHFAAMAVELDAALETSARLDRELAEERRQVMVLREASALAARRAHELMRTVTAERARTTELEEAVTRAEARVSELEGERDAERARAAELEAERAAGHQAKRAADKTQAELATASAALAREQRAVEGLRAELRAAEEEVERVRRTAAEAVAQAPTHEELEEERRRADRANAALAAARAHSEMAEAEAKSALAQARAELRRAHEDGAAATEALNAEKQQTASLRAQLIQLEEELARVSQVVSERPSTEQLERERDRAEQERARAEQERARAEHERARAEQAEAAAEEAEVAAEQARREASDLSERVAELEHAQNDKSTAAATADKRTAERLRRELAGVRDELTRAKRAVTERPSIEELEQERARAEEAEAAAEEAEVAAEQARREASDLSERLAELERAQKGKSAAAATSEKRTVEKLRRELAAVRDELESARRAVVERPAAEELEQERQTVDALRAELSETRDELARVQAAVAVAPAVPEPEPAVPEPAMPEPERVVSEPEREPVSAEEPPAGDGSPGWAPAAQRALAAALAETTDWRAALKQSVKVIGVEGEWDAVAAWCPDGRHGFMKCAASWAGDAISSHTFETQIWQHRQKPPADLNGSPKSVVGLATAQDALLKAAAEEGMGSAVFVPISDGTQPIAMLQLLSGRAAAPSAELMLSLEGIALQLGSMARLLSSASTPQWRVGRL